MHPDVRTVIIPAKKWKMEEVPAFVSEADRVAILDRDHLNWA